MITQTWDYFLDAFPSGSSIKLPRPPLQSVTYLQYTDEDGVTSTFSSSSYMVDANSEPGRLVLLAGESWPTDALYPAAAVNLRFVAGYGAAADVPQWSKQAILLLVGHWYENREAVLTGAMPREIPFGVARLLGLRKFWSF